MLIILGGLPATGKTTVARELARRIGAMHLRIDTIEEALLAEQIVPEDMGPAGYVVAYAVASDNLRLGHTVIADSVNPIEITRSAWREVALESGVPFLEVEIINSNLELHRARLENRTGSRTVTWNQVLTREIEPWEDVGVRIDTANSSVEEAVERIIAGIKEFQI